MQCTKTKGTSIVVTDPKGTLIVETGKMLVAAGYNVRAFNTINFQKSMHYNPFAYIRSEKDILKRIISMLPASPPWRWIVIPAMRSAALPGIS